MLSLCNPPYKQTDKSTVMNLIPPWQRQGLASRDLRFAFLEEVVCKCGFHYLLEKLDC